MKTIPAKINGVMIESLSGQIGNSIKKIWKYPAKLHAIAKIDEQETHNYNTQYKLFCTIKKDGEKTSDIKFIHGNEGCKNPCKITQRVGQDEPQIVFTFEVLKPGKYEVTIGNYIDIGFTTSFEIVDDYND